MVGVTTFRSGNPTLTAKTFAKYRIAPGVEQMTLGGTVNKTAMSLGVLLIAALYVWNRGADDPRLGVWILVSSSEVTVGLTNVSDTCCRSTMAVALAR